MNLFLLFDGTWKGSQEHTNSYRCHLSLGDHTKDRGRQVRAMEKQIDDLSWGFELYESFTLKHNIAFTWNPPMAIETMKTAPTARPPWQTPWTMPCPTMASCTSRHSPWAGPRN